MRIRPAAEDPLERLALLLNLAPLPAGYALFGMSAGRTVGLGQKLGIFKALLGGPASASALAEMLQLQVAGTRLLCESLTALGVLASDGDAFSLARRSRKWLDPSSDTYIGTWIEHSVSYWDWYASLERVVRDGHSVEIHAGHEDDPEYWRIYITGQYELARLCAREVAGRVALPDDASSLIDIAGGHGWFAAALCARHPKLRARVLDLPGSARVGREIIARAGMSERVSHIDGDMFTAEMGGPHDAALLFDILHHLTAEETVRLLRRVREALRPGATIAILDVFRSDGERQSMIASTLGLLFHITSGADLHSPSELTGYLRRCGFSTPRRSRLHRIPDQALYQAQAI